MSPRERQMTGTQSGEELNPWEPGPDIEMELGIQPDDVLARISAAVENDRLALNEFNRTLTRSLEGRVLAEKFDFRVVEGSRGTNAFSLICEGKVEPARRGSMVKVRFHMRSLARLFLIAWTAFVFLIGVYEVMDAWPNLPSWRMLAVTMFVTVLVIVLFILAKGYGRRQEVRMRKLLKAMFADTTLYMRERPVVH